MISIPRHLISGGIRREQTGGPGVGSIISPTTGPTLTMGGQWAYYCWGPWWSIPHVDIKIKKK